MNVPGVAGDIVWVPEVAILPFHAVSAEQEVALADDQVRLALWPAVMLKGFVAMVSVGSETGTATARVTEFVVVPPAPTQVSA